MFSIKIEPRRITIMYNDLWAGGAYIDKHGFVHYTLENPDHRRQGLMSKALDALTEPFVFCDDPRVADFGCYMTEKGQAFADAYRIARNIPLPTHMWVELSHPSIGRNYYGRKHILRPSPSHCDGTLRPGMILARFANHSGWHEFEHEDKNVIMYGARVVTYQRA